MVAKPPDRYGVMGNPVSHSKSPQIHRLFAAQTGQQLSYQAITVAHDGLPDALREFAEAGGKGLNITVPFKEEAWRCMHACSARARAAEAVNTICFQADGQWYGENTDGAGLVRDLVSNLTVHVRDRRVLVLGAGGAVRGVLAPLLAQAPKQLVIANRTVAKAQALARLFSEQGSLQGVGFEALAGAQFDVVINGTSASLHGKLPALPDGLFTADALAYDMMYGARPTPFMVWAQTQGVARAADGLGMLVEQAAESFYLWRKVRPQTAPVLKALRAAMGAA